MIRVAERKSVTKLVSQYPSGIFVTVAVVGNSTDSTPLRACARVEVWKVWKCTEHQQGRAKWEALDRQIATGGYWGLRSAVDGQSDGLPAGEGGYDSFRSDHSAMILS